jgi:alkylation response protein AidB-like acyl-CoA dehydrogenase
VLAEGVAARRFYEQARDEWRVLTSGALVGLGTAALGLGVGYAKERHQFGVPIGSFQSIARDLADVATLIDGARLLARQAAWARAEDDQDFHSLAGMAFLFATRAARRASNVALHVHGGYGFTLEYDIQLYYRRAQAWPLAFGDPQLGVAQLADALFGPIEVA